MYSIFEKSAGRLELNEPTSLWQLAASDGKARDKVNGASGLHLIESKGKWASTVFMYQNSAVVAAMVTQRETELVASLSVFSTSVFYEGM